MELQKEDQLQKLARLKEQLTDPEQDKLSLEQFLNLTKEAAARLQAADSLIKDKICRLIFLNFTVDEENVLSYQAKEPFATLLKLRESTSSRGDRN